MCYFCVEQSCYPPDDIDIRAREREQTALDLEAELGPRPSVASVLRAMRLRRGGRR